MADLLGGLLGGRRARSRWESSTARWGADWTAGQVRPWLAAGVCRHKTLVGAYESSWWVGHTVSVLLEGTVSRGQTGLLVLL